MDYAIFVYGGDARCLKICIEQVRRVDSKANFWVFDDGRYPLQGNQIPIGDDIHYEVTYFDRKFNLNGLECMRGMLSCLNRIPGDAPVIKIDADTLLMSTDEIKRSLDSGKFAGGMQCSVALAWAGCCYWLTRRAIKDALELLVRREWPEGKDGYPEDVWLTRVLLYLYGHSLVDVIEFNGGRRLIGIRTTDQRELIEIAQLARNGVCAVHCGQMAFYDPICAKFNCTKREACAAIMRAILAGDGVCVLE